MICTFSHITFYYSATIKGDLTTKNSKHYSNVEEFTLLKNKDKHAGHRIRDFHDGDILIYQQDRCHICSTICLRFRSTYDHPITNGYL